MSGVARFVKKVWKQKFRFQKKYWKVAAIAVVAYFTFGLAAGAMPAAGAATGTTAAGVGAAATGTGVMTTTAAAATSSAAGAAATVAGIETVTVTAAAAGGISASGVAAAAAAGAGAVAGGAAGSGGGYKPAKPAEPVQTQQPPKPGILDKAKGAWKDMSFTDKLLLAKAGVDVVSTLTGPSPEEEAALAAKWQGAFYGKTAEEAEASLRSGSGTQFVNQQTSQATAKPPATQPGGPGRRDIVPMGAPAEAGPGAMPGQGMPLQSVAQTPQTATPGQAPQQVTNQGGNRDLFATRAPGVRYLV
jgi:hypothetical protein